MESQVLLSTMGQENNNINRLIKNINLNSDCVIINQCNRDEKIEYYHNGYKVKLINSKDVGLSKSRNIAIKNSNSEICIIADDDLEYVDNFNKIISREFSRNKKIDILVFKVDGKNKKFKKYLNREKRLSYLSSMKVSSVQIAFRRKSIVEKKLYFNELLGAGAKYSMGEENDFLFRCLKKGLKIKYIPIKIADLYIGESSWFNGYNDKYFIDRGASFTSMSKRFSNILIVQFAIRKRKLYKDKMSVIKAIKLMLCGKKDYLNQFE